MIKLKLLLIVLLLLMATLAQAENCPTQVNIAVQLNSNTNPTSPQLSDSAQNRVCVKSGGRVVFHRTGQGASNGFGIFLKNGSWSAQSSNNKVYYDAPVVESQTEQTYGVSMPDAGTDLDPVIVIVPLLGL